jgi:hypothetical protein
VVLSTGIFTRKTVNRQLHSTPVDSIYKGGIVKNNTTVHAMSRTKITRETEHIRYKEDLR